MCHGKIVRNSHSRVEQNPTLKTRNHGMPVAPVQYKPVVLNLFAEGSQIQIYDFVRESR